MISGILLLASLAAGPSEWAAQEEMLLLDTSGLSDPDHTRDLLMTVGARRLEDEQLLVDRTTLQKMLEDVGEESVLGPGASLEQLIQVRRGLGTERIFDPVVAGPVLEEYADSSRLRDIASRLQHSDFKDCSPAARAYDLAAQAHDLPAMKLHGPKVDAHCLRSLLHWRRLDGEFRTDPIPPLLEGTVTSGLAALAILERQTYSGEIAYVCGGLLRPGNRVLTAAHCFGEFPAHRSALEEGRLRLRLARDPQGPSWAVKSLNQPWRNPEPVQSDVVELEILSDQIIPVPASEFVAFQEQTDPLVLGYFPHFDSTREIEGDNAPLSKFPTWYRGLRWSRPGLCHAINAADRCVRLLCQTINGYSGSPVFDQNAHQPGQPLRVLGLVSRPDHSQAACGAFLEYSTLAYTEVRQTNPPNDITWIEQFDFATPSALAGKPFTPENHHDR